MHIPYNFKKEDDLIDYLQHNKKNSKALILGCSEVLFEYSFPYYENIYEFSNWNEDYDLYYFYAHLTDEQITLFHKFFPKVIFVDVWSLKSLGKIVEYCSKLKWRECLSICYYACKLVQYYDICVILEQDFLLTGDLKSQLDKLNPTSFDFAAVPDQGPELTAHSFLYRRKYGYFTHSKLVDADINPDYIFNGGFLIFSKSLLKKVSYEKLVHLVSKRLEKSYEETGAYLSQERVLTPLIKPLKLNYLPLSFNFNSSIIGSIDKLKSGPKLCLHFVQYKLWNDKNLQLCFPYWAQLIDKICAKLDSVSDPAIMPQALLISTKLRASNKLKGHSVEFERLGIINLLQFYNAVLPDLCSFMAQSRQFHLEPIKNQQSLILFCNSCSNFTRVYIEPLTCFASDLTYASVKMVIRLSCYQNCNTPLEIIDLPEYRALSDDFKQNFAFAKIEMTDRQIKLGTFFMLSDFKLYASKLEAFFSRHQDFIEKF